MVLPVPLIFLIRRSGTLGVSSSNGNFPRAKRARMGGKDGSEPGREKKQRRTVIDDDDMMLDTPYSAPPGTVRLDEFVHYELK